MKKIKGVYRVVGAAVAALTYSASAQAAGDAASMFSNMTTQVKAAAAFFLIVLALVGLYYAAQGIMEFMGSKNNPQFSPGWAFGKIIGGVILMGFVLFIGIMAASSIGGGSPSGLSALGVGG